MKHRPCHLRHVWLARQIGASHTPNIEMHGGQGWHPKIAGGFFNAPFMMHIGTTSRRRFVGVHPPPGSLRLDSDAPVRQGRRSCTQGRCQIQGAFFTHYPVSNLHAFFENRCIFTHGFSKPLKTVLKTVVFSHTVLKTVVFKKKKEFFFFLKIKRFSKPCGNLRRFSSTVFNGFQRFSKNA